MSGLAYFDKCCHTKWRKQFEKKSWAAMQYVVDLFLHEVHKNNAFELIKHYNDTLSGIKRTYYIS